MLTFAMLLNNWAGFLLGFLLSKFAPLHLTPSEACFSTSRTLNSLTECLEEFIVLKGFYDQQTYLAAQPTIAQRKAWSQAVHTLLSTHNNCSSAIVPSEIQDIYSISSFKDISGKSFCVLYERTVSPCSKYYEKGWGFAMVPSSRDDASRLIHISAPHPLYDGETAAQAAQIFGETGAKSLLVPGRMRNAFYAPSPCVQPTSSRSIYYITDPAHNDKEPFFDANRAIWEWQNQHGGCASSLCSFIQFHGKAETTCRADTIFLSTGLPQSTWYTDEVDRPVKRLKDQLLLAFNSGTTTPSTISLPSDSQCILTATKNVVGRYLNNYPSSHDVCTRNANPATTNGVFIHAEQGAMARGASAREAWVHALNNTFVVVNTHWWDQA